MTKTAITINDAAIAAIDDEACRLMGEAQYGEYLLNRLDDEPYDCEPEDVGPGRCTIAEYDAMRAQREADLEADLRAELADRQHRLDAALEALYDCSIQCDYAACL